HWPELLTRVRVLIWLSETATVASPRHMRGIQEEMTMKWMQAALLALIGVGTAARPAASEPWHITGTLSEACTCTVPCTCNFGESPSPHAFCYAIVGMDIEHGNYGAVKLDGIRGGGAQG